MVFHIRIYKSHTSRFTLWGKRGDPLNESSKLYTYGRIHHHHHHQSTWISLNFFVLFSLQMNQQCKVCGEPAAGFHFGAFTCEGCKVSKKGDDYNPPPNQHPLTHPPFKKFLILYSGNLGKRLCACVCA